MDRHHVQVQTTTPKEASQGKQERGEGLGLAFFTAVHPGIATCGDFKAFQTAGKYSVTVYCLVFIIITKAADIKKQQRFHEFPNGFTQLNCSNLVNVKRTNFSPGPKPSTAICALGCPGLS